ncbi:MAG TPA: ABC transporter permease [Phycisphaerae bacterium]|nr:ABC transporter permease [Phycisphaerales bacterium]HRX84207.1 ABC transporter permease [Phycisphaerae bacterium]
MLARKTRRDLRRNAGILLGVVAIIAVGAGSMVALGTAQRILEASQQAYYRDYRFADFWVDLKKAPLTVVDQIARLPGVARVEGRVVYDVILDLPDVDQPLIGRLMSAPQTHFRDTINGVCLVRGSGFSADRTNEVILSDTFARAHDLQPGDRIALILNRKRESFVIVGTAISPEYVYMVRGDGDLAPDPEHFGILYIRADYARDVLNFQDACNQIVGRIVPGEEPRLEALLDRIERLCAPYGVFAARPRARQASHRFLSDEIRSLGVTAVVMPAIFLGVAALVLNVLMGRVTQRQRTVIGTLKALGYSNRQVLRHFLLFGLWVGLAGGVAGGVIGLLLASGMMSIYRTFFQFPRYVTHVYPDLLLFGVAVSATFAVLGALKGAWRVLELQPAEAMRPQPPERGGAIYLERVRGLWQRLSFRSHMALRATMRHPGRTATGVIAMALSAAMIYLTLVFYDSTYYLLDYQFDAVARSDADIGMRDDASRAALREAERLPGVDAAEPVLGVACHLRHGWRERRVVVTGLAADHRLTIPRNADLTPVVIPPEGLVLTRKLAELLGVGPGDELTFTPVRGRRETRRVRVAATVDSFLGLTCYADERYLSGLVGEALAMNGVQLAVNPAKRTALFRAVKELPNAQGFSMQQDARHGIEKTLTQSMAASLGITILFAAVIAFGSMLNNSLIEIGDRLREISTMRVLGYASREVAGIFLRQNVIIAAAGLALSFPLGYVLARIVAHAYDTELFRMPLVFRPWTALTTAGLALSFVLVAQVLVYRAVARTDWLEGLKVKE